MIDIEAVLAAARELEESGAPFVEGAVRAALQPIGHPPVDHAPVPELGEADTVG
ncbi:hypothetical protein [Streptomyces scabiei]|uniref:hypothetical protein n=1 Tax=Streptomyces scabiei TaxID=1930 RepID=UPI0029BB12A2|nr:hypothetical protein [Streptomyces scabiei]MDX3205163.1 hypothetical protein [Streptomyces scabiei]